LESGVQLLRRTPNVVGHKAPPTRFGGKAKRQLDELSRLAGCRVGQRVDDVVADVTGATVVLCSTRRRLTDFPRDALRPDTV